HLWKSMLLLFFFSSRRRHTSSKRDWSSDVCSSDLVTRFVNPASRAARLMIDHAPTRDRGVPRALRNTSPRPLPLSRRGRISRARSEERRVGEEGRARGSRGRGGEQGEGDLAQGGQD